MESEVTNDKKTLRILKRGKGSAKKRWDSQLGRGRENQWRKRKRTNGKDMEPLTRRCSQFTEGLKGPVEE